jgi:hypothetical protein
LGRPCVSGSFSFRGWVPGLFSDIADNSSVATGQHGDPRANRGGRARPRRHVACEAVPFLELVFTLEAIRKLAERGLSADDVADVFARRWW